MAQAITPHTYVYDYYAGETLQEADLCVIDGEDFYFSHTLATSAADIQVISKANLIVAGRLQAKTDLVVKGTNVLILGGLQSEQGPITIDAENIYVFGGVIEVENGDISLNAKNALKIFGTVHTPKPEGLSLKYRTCTISFTCLEYIKHVQDLLKETLIKKSGKSFAQAVTNAAVYMDDPYGKKPPGQDTYPLFLAAFPKRLAAPAVDTSAAGSKPADEAKGDEKKAS